MVNTQVQSLYRKICNYTYLQIYLIKSLAELKLNRTNNLALIVEMDKRKCNLYTVPTSSTLRLLFKSNKNTFLNKNQGVLNLFFRGQFA